MLGYYDLSVLSLSVMVSKKKVWMGGGGGRRGSSLLLAKGVVVIMSCRRRYRLSVVGVTTKDVCSLTR